MAIIYCSGRLWRAQGGQIEFFTHFLGVDSGRFALRLNGKLAGRASGEMRVAWLRRGMFYAGY